MFRAELHGKLPSEYRRREDILTSNVFGFLEAADRHLFLARYLRDYLGLEVTDAEANAAEFEFWPTYADGTEPDVVVSVGNWYILFEAKLYSDFGLDANDAERNQLRRELFEGRREASRRGLRFRLVTVTLESWRDVNRYPDIRPNDRAHWIWSNWQTVHALLDDVQVSKRGSLGSQLHRILDNRGLRGFRGYAGIGNVPSPPEVVFLSVSATRFPGFFRGYQYLPAFDVVNPGAVFWSPDKRFYRNALQVKSSTMIFWSEGEKK
jgi:hypothetical protein